MLSITDEGFGIAPINICKIRTPLFITKGNRTGLGLATCYKIIECHKVKILIDSDRTSFMVYFPVTDQVLEQSDDGAVI